jgi:hypothetical protein
LLLLRPPVLISDLIIIQGNLIYDDGIVHRRTLARNFCMSLSHSWWSYWIKFQEISFSEFAGSKFLVTWRCQNPYQWSPRRNIYEGLLSCVRHICLVKQPHFPIICVWIIIIFFLGGGGVYIEKWVLLNQLLYAEIN